MKNIGHIWHKEAEIIIRSPRTRKNTPQRSRDYYQKPENKEKHTETVKKYYEANKEKINQHIKEKRESNKIKSVVSKLESIDMEVLAKILIEARKTKLLEIQE